MKNRHQTERVKMLMTALIFGVLNSAAYSQFDTDSLRAAKKGLSDSSQAKRRLGDYFPGEFPCNAEIKSGESILLDSSMEYREDGDFIYVTRNYHRTTQPPFTYKYSKKDDSLYDEVGEERRILLEGPVAVGHLSSINELPYEIVAIDESIQTRIGSLRCLVLKKRSSVGLGYEYEFYAEGVGYVGTLGSTSRFLPPNTTLNRASYNAWSGIKLVEYLHKTDCSGSTLKSKVEAKAKYAYEEAQKKNTIKAFEEFIQSYPTSTYVRDAHRSIGKLRLIEKLGQGRSSSSNSN